MIWKLISILSFFKESLKNNELLPSPEEDQAEEDHYSGEFHQAEKADDREQQRKEEMDDGVRTPPPLPSMLKTSPKMSDEVSSTVNIKTPERSSFEATLNKGENPTVWSGEVDMPDVAKFAVTAHAVSGNTDYLTVDLRESLKIVGRIPPQTIWDYLVQVRELGTKEMLLIRLQPTSDSEAAANYSRFFEYLQGRGRFAVVGNASKNVKDCYVLPLGAEDKLHECLMPLDGPGLPEGGEGRRHGMLLALIVRGRRKRPRDTYYISLKKAKDKGSKGGSSSSPPQLTDEDIKDMVENSGETPRKKSKDSMDEDYDPAMAGQGFGGGGEDEGSC